MALNMNGLQELNNYIDTFTKLLSSFNTGSLLGSFLSVEDGGIFTQNIFEVTGMLRRHLGPDNVYSVNIVNTVNNNTTDFPGGPTIVACQGVIAILKAARKEYENNGNVIKVSSSDANIEQYVSSSRIDELKGIVSDKHDFTKLIRLCEELNVANTEKNYFSIAMLLRGIIDHIPPLFAFKTFTEIANNYSGSKSFVSAMKHLDNSSRNVADTHLHQQIRKKEVLPNFTQVDFRSDLDLLLSEIVRLNKL